MVAFEERNLLEDDPRFWSPSAFDVVFCRNVIMYFPPPVARAVVGRLARSLVPEGHLFLGHAETLRGISRDFQLVQSHETFYYRRKSETGDVASDPSLAPTVPARSVAVPRETADPDWYGTIHRATERIAFLRGTRPAREASTVVQSPQSATRTGGTESPVLGPTRKALEEERFDDALRLLEGLPTQSETDPEALLLRAVVLTSRGEVETATDLLRRLLEVDDLNSGGHYQMGLCCEQRGDIEEAIHHYRSATYLDPSFAMPHLRLAGLAKRQGNPECARREFEQALDLLPLEDTSRVLLFGGGLGEAALIRLCRVELRGIGGSDE